MNNNLTKIDDNLYYDERSAGGIVYKIVSGRVMWLVIKTAGRRGMGAKRARVKFPKGHVQGAEFLKMTALREVEEEGRVKAEIVAKIGSRDYNIWDKINKRKIIKKVTFFLMKYSSDSSLRHFDREMVMSREWLSYDEACQKLAYDSEKLLLTKAREKLTRILR